MTSTCESAISRRISPEVCIKFPPSPIRGRREHRVHAAPAVSCATVHKKTHTSIQVKRRQSGIPCAMVLRLISCSPRRPGFLATVAPEKLASQELDTSVGVSGPHDFAVRKPALSSLAPPASTASRPASVTIANRPSVGRDCKSYSLICISEKQKYFCEGGWTGQPPTRSPDLPVRQIKRPVRQQIAGWAELSRNPS